MKKRVDSRAMSTACNAMNCKRTLVFNVLSTFMASLLCACSIASLQPDFSPSTAAVPVDFSPGPDGTPLPAPTKAVGEKWPPEVKAFIDGMIALFGERERPPLSTQEIESTLGVKLTPQSFIWAQVDASYRISGSPLLNPLSANQLANYDVGSKNKNGRRLHVFQFPLDPKNFCISPYDFAVYLGNQYSPELEMPLRAAFKTLDCSYPPAYEWGMFNRASNGKYLGYPHLGIALTASNSCIVIFRAMTHTFERN